MLLYVCIRHIINMHAIHTTEKCKLYTNAEEDDQRAMKEAGLKALESATTSSSSTTTGVGSVGGGDNKRQKTATAGGVTANAATGVPTVDINKLLGPPVPARPVPTAAALLAEAHAINARIHQMVAGRLPHLNANNLYNHPYAPVYPPVLQVPPLQGAVMRPQARYIAPPPLPVPAAAAAIPIRGGFVGQNNPAQPMPTLAPADARRRGGGAVHFADLPLPPPPLMRTAIVTGTTVPLAVAMTPEQRQPWTPGDDEVQIIDPPPNNTGRNYDPGNIGRKRKQD